VFVIVDIRNRLIPTSATIIMFIATVSPALHGASKALATVNRASQSVLCKGSLPYHWRTNANRKVSRKLAKQLLIFIDYGVFLSRNPKASVGALASNSDNGAKVLQRLQVTAIVKAEYWHIACIDKAGKLISPIGELASVRHYGEIISAQRLGRAHNIAPFASVAIVAYATLDLPQLVARRTTGPGL
jgi:hypothetical protein